MKKIALIIGLILTIMISNFVTFADNCEDISNKVFRVHILANSDSIEDQNLKLEIRDLITTKYAPKITNCCSVDEIKCYLNGKNKEIIEDCEEIIKSRGYDYTVTFEIINMFFTTRQYESYTLPAGNYDAIRIKIGTGNGKNWWCVMYPNLCLPSALDKESLSLFTKEELDVITKDSVKIKFKLYEIIKTLFKF